MIERPPFRPIAGANATLACSSTTGSTRLALTAVNAGAHRVLSARVLNLGPSEVFLAFGDSAVTVTAGGAVNSANDGGMSLPPGAIEVFDYQPGDTNVVGVCAAGGTATVRISLGYGD